MSTDWFQDVLDFHKKFGCYMQESPAFPDQEIQDLRTRLNQEEFDELKEAIANKNLPQLADAATDLIYVLIGQMIAFGIDIRPIWNQVHNSNMQKINGGKRKDGKVLKPEGWTHPDIAAMFKTLPKIDTQSTETIKPPIVCLCGSTKFKQTWINENSRLTQEGFIVLAVGLWGHHERRFPTPEVKKQLDELHKRKIDLADLVYVLDVDKYIGESTKSEIEYAIKHNKPIQYLSEQFPDYVEPQDPLIEANKQITMLMQAIGQEDQ